LYKNFKDVNSKQPSTNNTGKIRQSDPFKNKVIHATSSNEVINQTKNMPIVNERNAKNIVVSKIINDKDKSKLNKHENNISNGKKIYFLILN
jgi:hypothetical protein